MNRQFTNSNIYLVFHTETLRHELHYGGMGGMEEYDVVLIGAGHNGLVCAAYLLKAGYTVLLLEKNSIPGGAATTEELLPEQAPGFKFNRCAVDHFFIHLGPVVEELELNKYGLEYLFLHLMDSSDVDAADPNLRERLDHRIVNHNETIFKIDCALSEPLRFEHHNHRDEYLIGTVLIADSVAHVEVAHTDPTIGKIPDDASVKRLSQKITQVLGNAGNLFKP